MIWGGTTGGPCPVQRSGDGAILFSYGGSLLYQNIAINQALANSGTGIQVRGYQYGWTIKNANAGSSQNPSYDPLSIRISLYDNTNKNIIEDKTFDYGQRINDWTRYTGTQPFINYEKYSLASVGNLSISISSRDAGYWAGYYGPEIRDIDVRLKYSVDPCGANPLASPTCEGYQQAYLAQQCAANTLYSTSCPGWQQAYFNQQCTLNPLFGSNCPGYAAAYLNQQCTLNQLYSPECPLYKQTYFNQQCTANPLYDKECPGYQQAYFNQQCTANPLHNAQCPGYATALFNQQCAANPLSSIRCEGYQQAYFSQQCMANALYSPQCPGYQQAYFNQQCGMNTLYNINCPGYAEAYRNKLVADSCKANPQSNPQCPGYTAASTTVSSSPVVVTQTTSSPTEQPLVADPVVNQVITSSASTTSQTSPTSQTRQEQPLGSGLTVSGLTPGLSILPPPPQRSRSGSSTSGNQRSNAAAQAIARTEAVAKDAQAQQQDAAMSAMANVPGFDAYLNARIPDAAFYATREVYKNVTLPDNRRAERALSQRSDRIHQQMIEQQYNR